MDAMYKSLRMMLGISFNALIAIVLIYLAYTFAVRGFHRGEALAVQLSEERAVTEIVFVLEEDTPPGQVARMLEEEGVIGSAFFHRLELMLMGNNSDYPAGTYILNTDMTAQQINRALRAGPEARVQNRITIREGWRLRDIAIYLESREFFTAEEFLYAADNHDFGFRFIENIPDRPNRLEGYLFPDTYFLSANPTPVEVISLMLQRFNDVFTFEYRMRAEELGLTMDEVVIIASMIEREVRVPEERPKVARVIFNRLDIGMLLQIDATIQFVLDRHVERVLYEHLEIESPFNTYRYPGLPLGPISSPGAASIRAALYPEDGNWLFYVLIDSETGAHYFTHSHERHEYMRRHHMPRPWDD